MLAELGLLEMAPDPRPVPSQSGQAVYRDRFGGGITNNIERNAAPLTGAIAEPAAATSNNYRTFCQNAESDVPDPCRENFPSGDTLELSNELRQAAEHCQNIAERLKRKGDAVLKPNDETNNCSQEARPNTNKESDAENIRLRQVVKDVTEINKRWQKYNRQQQDYIQRLLASNRSLQQEKAEAEVAAILKSGKEEQTRKSQIPLSFRHSDSSLMDNSAVMNQLRHSYESAVKENCRLEKEIEEMSVKEESFKEQMVRLRQGHREEILVLEMQIKAHKEDWEAEKREKDAEQSKTRRLQTEVDMLKLKCRNYSERLNVVERSCRCGFGAGDDDINDWRTLRRHHSSSPTAPPFCENNIVVDYPHSNHSQSEPKLISRGSNDGDNSIARSRSKSFEIVELNQSEATDQNAVICPGCHKQFTSHQHLHFLDHFETCQNK